MDVSGTINHVTTNLLRSDYCFSEGLPLISISSPLTRLTLYILDSALDSITSKYSIFMLRILKLYLSDYCITVSCSEKHF